MKKEKPPIEENVDLELEYKLLHFYDKIKPYLKHILIALIVLILLVIYLLYRKSANEERLNKASIYVYEISKDIENKNYEDAKKKIKFFKANFADTDFIKLVYAYQLIIEKNENKLSKETVKKLKEKLDTDQTKAYFTEFEGYIDYKNKNYEGSLLKLENVKQNHFNYLSAITLKAIIFKEKGKENEAKQLFEEIKELAKGKYNYFENIAKGSL